MLTGNDLRQKYLDFFVAKGHQVIPSSPLVPQNDPTVLFTTAGMHPLVHYLLGQPHALGKRLVDFQKCLRTDDIDEVGDANHHTFFEMLGNWSLGDYFKKEAISWSYSFLTEELKLDPKRLYITCFVGDQDAPQDVESAKIWESLGIPPERIFFYGKKDNWWGPAGITGPCGPDTEMHYDLTLKPHASDCRPGCACGRFSEIWNDVFMQYNKMADGSFEKLQTPNVDTGMGLERALAIVNGLDDDYLTELWLPAIEKISQLSNVSYEKHTKPFRIIADHLRAAAFVIADDVQPSNKERGYILRRLIRRAILQLNRLEIKPYSPAIFEIVDIFISMMSPTYPELLEKKDLIHQTLLEEVSRFERTLEKGLREFNKLPLIDGKTAFNLFTTFGFPWELTLELANEKDQWVDRGAFESEFKKHQELSRTAAAGMFKGGLADRSETVTKYHTATHLLHQALRDVLGNHVHQSGSNLTSERLRFDFTHDRSLTIEQLNQVEAIVNEKIKLDLPVTLTVMDYDAAIASGALAFFKEKYPPKVNVYKIGDYSKELCGGPHVTHTGEIGKMKVIKQESLGSSLRRIYLKPDSAN